MSEIYKRNVYSYYVRKSDKVAHNYMFWENDDASWHIIKHRFSVDYGDETTELSIPKEVLHKILTDSTKESLSE